jgi:hypothetical protein
MRASTGVGRRRGRPRAVIAASVVAVSLMALAGCSASPAASTQQLERTLLERDRIAVAAHEASTARVAVYLRDKWGPVRLPESEIDRWVAASEWAPTVARCIADAGYPGVRSADDGERLDFSALRVGGLREQFELEVASFDCQARFPVRAWFASVVREVEAPWAHGYTQEVLVPCLLAAGYDVLPVPEVELFAETWRTDDQYDPYALVGGAPPVRVRAESTCPAADHVLDAAP